MDAVFYSKITRNPNNQQNNLYELLHITPAQPITPAENPPKEVECHFHPQNNKVYILKKRSKLKVNTVRDIRVSFEKDVLLDLPKELEKQQNVLLRKIRSGSIQDEKTKTAAKNILNSDMPVTRQSWQMLMNINPEDQAHSSQFVLWNGTCIQISGSKGGKNKFLCNRDLSKFSRLTSKESIHKLKKKIFKKKKNLLRNSLSINFKPGPLSRKKYLDASYQKYNVGNIELVNLPKIGLEVTPTYGSNLDPSISSLLTNFREVNGIISPKWAAFAVSMVGSVKGPCINQTNENCKTTFYLDYKNNQQRTLMRRNVENEIRQYPVTTQASHFSVDDNTTLPEIEEMLDKILDAVEIHVDENKYYTGAETPRIISKTVSLEPTVITKEKSKKRYCELDRLDVKVINLSENSNLNEKKECNNSFCSLGCICNSLQCSFNFKNHCGRVKCMFKCECDFSKYNAIDTKETDCSEFLPGLLNIDNMNYNLSKEEQKFQQTVVVTDDKSILLKSKKRNWKSSTKYAEFYSNMCLKSDLKQKKRLAVIDIKLDLENVEPWCMVHSLYKCFCKGKFMDSITNEKQVSEVEKHIDEVRKEPIESNINEELDRDKNFDRQTKKRKIQCDPETYNENRINDDVSFVGYAKHYSTCARTKAYKGRNYSKIYYLTIHNKIKDLESNDLFIQKRLKSIITQGKNSNDDDANKMKNVSCNDLVADVSDTDLKSTEALKEDNRRLRLNDMLPLGDNTYPVTATAPPELKLNENDADVQSQSKLTEVHPICSSPNEHRVDANTNKTSGLKIFDILRNQPIINRPRLVSWVENGFKHYKKRLEMGLQFVLDPPKKGRITIYAWDFILKRYSERKNLFLVSKQAPYRIFIANSLSQHCINIDEIRFADLNKYPVLVKNLLTNNKGPKDNFCLLYGLTHCWELVGSVVKTKNNLSDIQESENDYSQDSIDMPSEEHSSDSPSNKDFVNELSSFVSSEDHKAKNSSKWFVMTIEKDFSEIQFYNHNFFVKYESIIQSIEVARKAGKTVRLSPKRNVHKNNDPQFGIYAVPSSKDYCVFIGPYECDENLGIEAIKTSITDKNMKRTRGVWVSTNKVDNIKLVDNPMSFIPKKFEKNENIMLPIVNDSTEPLEQSFNSDLDIRPSTSTENQVIISEMPKNKTVKVIKISKNSPKVQVLSKPGNWKPSPKISTLQNLPSATVPMYSILRNNANTAPIVVSSDSAHKSVWPENLPPLDELPVIIDTGTGELGGSQAQLSHTTVIQPKLKPVAEVAPQIKISAIYSPTDLDNQRNAPRSETNMFILKPEEINQRLDAKIQSTVLNSTLIAGGSSDHNNMMDVEDFLDSAATCDGDDETYLISDDESEKIKEVLIKCKNIQQIGLIRGKINQEGEVSFEFPGFKYTDFYKKDMAFNKITQVLSRKVHVCVPKYLSLEWQIIERMEDEAGELMKVEDLGPHVVLTKKGFLYKKNLLKTCVKKPTGAALTSGTTAADNTEQTETDHENSRMCEENADSTKRVEDIVSSKIKVYKDAIVKSISDNNAGQMEIDRAGPSLTAGSVDSSAVKVDDTLFRNTKVYKDAIVKSIAEASHKDRKRLTTTLADMLCASSDIL